VGGAALVSATLIRVLSPNVATAMHRAITTLPSLAVVRHRTISVMPRPSAPPLLTDRMVESRIERNCPAAGLPSTTWPPPASSARSIGGDARASPQMAGAREEGWKQNRPAATFVQPARASGEALQRKCGARSRGGELWGGAGGSSVSSLGVTRGTCSLESNTSTVFRFELRSVLHV